MSENPRRYYPWTSAQLKRLKRVYLTMSQAELEQEFAPHPPSSIAGAARGMGLRRCAIRRDWRSICTAHIMKTGLFKVSRHDA